MIATLNAVAATLCGIVVLLATVRGVVAELSRDDSGHLALRRRSRGWYTAAGFTLVTAFVALLAILVLRVLVELG